MAPNIGFYAGSDTTIYHLDGSGLGFYGDASFGASVEVAGWQGRTFITNSNGTVQGPEVDNCRVLLDGNGDVVPTGCILGQSGDGINLLEVPNYLATLNVRLTTDTPVKAQNATLRIYDRTTPTTPPDGVTTAVAEIIHPDEVQNPNGSGSSTWTFFPSSGNPPMSLADSPGTSGLSPSGANTLDTRHDWYLALSASPDTIGSKMFGLYFSVEFV